MAACESRNRLCKYNKHQPSELLGSNTQQEIKQDLSYLPKKQFQKLLFPQS